LLGGWSEKQMSSKNNVNPGQYKVAGRERLGENLVQERDRQRMAKSRENFGQPGNRSGPPSNRATVVQPRDKSEPKGTRKNVAEARDRQAPAKKRESTPPAKRAAKRIAKLSGRSKTSRKSG
jgi:hypothetical protein